VEHVRSDNRDKPIMIPRIELPEAVAQVFITDKLVARSTPAPDYLREKLAIQDLADHMADHPGEVLPRLVKLAMEICEADSAGISVLEPETAQFRWLGLSGVLAAFEGATTPRHDSPCGVCLDHRGPILMEHPERAYAWIRDASINVPEVLLVPLEIKGQDPIGTLWVVAKNRGYFNGGHARVLSELASFAGVALRMIQSEERLKTALGHQETLTKEMSHRVKNVFALMNGMIRMTARTSPTPKDMADALVGRLHALSSAHALVRRSFSEAAIESASLDELAKTILRPHTGSHRVSGPPVSLGQHAANDLALVLHELATNAAKYGSLSRDGRVTVSWTVEGDELRINWVEEGGPAVEAMPTAKGFGTMLTERTLNGRLGGRIAYDWQESGLRVAMAMPVSGLRH
jgi:two-component sensor histidine kinase